MALLEKMLNENTFSTIISLPENNMEMVLAAIDAKVDALKFHINVEHFASGNHFESLDVYREFFQEVRSQFHGPIGIVIGDSVDKVSSANYEDLSAIGINYYSLYMNHIDSSALRQSTLEKTVAIGPYFNNERLLVFNSFNITAIELSIIDKDLYGDLLNFDDISRYMLIRSKTIKPLIIPSQKKLNAEDISMLKEIGINAVMLGAVAIGTTANDIYTNIKELKRLV